MSSQHSGFHYFLEAPKQGLFGDHCGRAVPTHSETRWWSRWEVMNEILKGYPDVEGFLQSSDILSPATVRNLLEILTDSVKNIQLRMELAVVIDAGKPFVKGTYTLEGDGPLALSTYEELRKSYDFISLSHYPNLTACVRNLASGNATVEQQLIAYAKSCVEPGFQYFQTKFDGELSPAVSFSRGLDCSPQKR